MIKYKNKIISCGNINDKITNLNLCLFVTSFGTDVVDICNKYFSIYLVELFCKYYFFKKVDTAPFLNLGYMITNYEIRFNYHISIRYNIRIKFEI